MRPTPGVRLAVGGASTAVAIALLAAYPTSTNRPAPAAAAGGGPGEVPAARPSPAPSSSTPPSSVSRTGEVATTRWGDVQVEITVAGGRITDATAVRVPDEHGESVQINREAVPLLEEDTLVAQSADVDTVSGATVTSEGYRESLQSAIDQAAL